MLDLGKFIKWEGDKKITNQKKKKKKKTLNFTISSPPKKRKKREKKGRKKKEKKTLKSPALWPRTEATYLKSSPLFIFSKKSFGQDSPLIHLFSKIIGSRFTTVETKLGEIHQGVLFFLGQDSLSNKENNKTMKRTFFQDSPCFKYY